MPAIKYWVDLTDEVRQCKQVLIFANMALVPDQGQKQYDVSVVGHIAK
jgi:hypothetical protein